MSIQSESRAAGAEEKEAARDTNEAAAVTVEDVRDTDSALREKRAMLDLELRLMLGNAKGIHEKHALHATPHYSRSLHMLADDALSAVATGSSTSYLAANATGGYREKEKPIESLPLLTQLDSEEQIRQQVAQRMDEIVQVQPEPTLHFALDVYLAECSSAGSLRNDCWSTLELLLQFQSHSLNSMHALGHVLVTRFLAHAGSNCIQERYGPRFSQILVALNKQMEKSLQRYEVLKETWRENGGEPLAATGKSKTAASGPTTAFPKKRLGWERCMVRSDLEDFFRYSMPLSAVRQKCGRFVQKLRLLALTNEREIFQDFRVAPVSSVTGQPAAAAVPSNAQAQTGAAASGTTQQSHSTAAAPVLRDLSEPPGFRDPRPIDLLPHNLDSLEDIDAENRRLKALWLSEAGMHASAEENSQQSGLDPLSLNPFEGTLDSDTDDPSSLPHSATDGASAGDSAWAHATRPNEHLLSARTRAQPSVFDTVSVRFASVFHAQAACYSPEGFLDYSTLYEDSNEQDQAALEREYAAMTEAEIAHAKALRSKREIELRRQELQRAKQAQQQQQQASLAESESSVSNPGSLAHSAAAAALAQSQKHVLRDTAHPVISSTGKIWGGKSLNNFRIKDAKEADQLLGETDATDANAAAMPQYAREDDSLRIPAPPFANFTFSNQKREDLFSDPRKLIGQDQRLSTGAIDKRVKGPDVYVRKATFLRQTRMHASLAEHLVQQKQTLRDYHAANSVDVQLRRHWDFVTKNQRADVAERELRRLVNEHLGLLDQSAAGAAAENLSQQSSPKQPAASLASRAAVGSGAASVAPGGSRNNPKQPQHHKRRSSLVLVQHSELLREGASAEEASAAAGAAAASQAGTMHVELESPQHKLHALYMLRILRLRELRARILDELNWKRSLHKLLVADEAVYVPEARRSTAGSKDSPAAATILGFDPASVLARAPSCAALCDRADSWSFGSAAGAGAGASVGAHIHVKDARKKVRVVYDAALTDLAQLESDLLALASIYIDRHAYVGMGMKGEADTELHAYQSLLSSLDGSIVTAAGSVGSGLAGLANKQPKRDAAREELRDQEFYPEQLLISSKTAKFSDAADRWSVLVDLFERESAFQQAQRELINVLYEAYAHTVDADKMRGLAQKILNMLVYRPHFDLDRSVSSFATIYSLECTLLRSQASLLREVLFSQLEEEILHGQSVGANAMVGGIAGTAQQTQQSTGSSASAHATFDWTLFAKEHSNNAGDLSNNLSSLKIHSGLPHPLQHAHGLFEVHRSFELVHDVLDELERVQEKAEECLALPKKKVLNVYLMQLRQKVVDNALHCFRSHMHEDTSFPASQHFTTLDFFESSPFFTSVPYALVKLAAIDANQRESMTGASRRAIVRSEDGNVVEGHEFQLYINFIELLQVRQQLLAVMYDSILLTRLYFAQADRLGVDTPRTMLDMHAASFATAGLTSPTKTGSVFAPQTTQAPSTFLLSSGSSEVGSFAISEIFHLLPKDLFKKLQDFERADVLGDRKTMQDLRSLLEVQTMQKRLLETVLHLHHLLGLATGDEAHARNADLDMLAPGFRQFFKKKSGPGSPQGGSGGAAGRGGAGSNMGAGAARQAKSPFLGMIAAITSSAGHANELGKTGEKGNAGNSKKPKRSPAHANRAIMLHASSSRIESQGCLSADTFVDLYALKQHARERLEQFLAQPASKDALLAVAQAGSAVHARLASLSSSSAGPSSGAVPLHATNQAVLPSERLIRQYVHEVLRALAPEIYAVEIGGLLSRFRALHAGPFGAFSPFVSLKFKLVGADGFLDHLLTVREAAPAVQNVPAPRVPFSLGLGSQDNSPTAAAGGAIKIPTPAEAAAAAAGAAAAPAPASVAPAASLAGSVTLPDGSVLPPASVRWGGGSSIGPGLAHASSGATPPTFGSLFQLPSMLGLLALLRLERGALPIDNLRQDLLARKTLFDTTVLNQSLAQLEFLPSLSFAGPKVAEQAAARMDFLRNELRELASEAAAPAAASASGSNPAASSASAPAGLTEVCSMLSYERQTAWMRLLCFVRFFTEALLIREDLLGLEYVSKICRIIRGELKDPSRPLEGSLAAPDLLKQLTASTVGLPWCSGALRPPDDAHCSQPLTALHRLASYFLAWCDARVLSSFEGLSREQAAAHRLVYRMSKDPSVLVVPGSDDPQAQSSTLARAERTARTMRGALATAQMFDAFYQRALEAEAASNGVSANSAAASKRAACVFTSLPLWPTLPGSNHSVWPLATRASLANAHVDLFADGGAYLRALEIADCNLVSKLNELRRRESARQRGVVPLAFLSILERTSNQSAMLMAAAASANHAPTSLHLSADMNDAGSAMHLTASALHAGALNNSAVFGFTLFSLGLRQHDQELLQSLLREQFQFDLFSSLVARTRVAYEKLQSEENLRGQHGGYAADPKYASILQATKLLLSEVQDTSYEMNVLKEWLASGGSVTGSGSSVASDSIVPSSSASTSQKHKVYYVLPKEGFNQLLSQLLREVLVFGEGHSEQKVQLLNVLNDYLLHITKEKDHLLASLKQEVQSQVEEYASQSLALVTDGQYRLCIELQNLKEQCEFLELYLDKSNASAESELTSSSSDILLRSSIEREYESKVHKLSMQILSLNSKLEINNISIRQRILTHYYNLKKNTLEEMIKNGSAPFLIKKRALKILSSEAKFQEMKNEYYALNATYLKLNTLFDMKDILQQRVFVKEENEMFLLTQSHEQLLQSIQSCEARSAIWTYELQETKNSLMLCHKYLEELQKNFLHYRKENSKLNAWKRVQLQKLAKLEVITRKFEDVSELDFEQLESDLRQKAEEMITALEYEKNADLRQKLMEAAQEKKLRQIRRLIQREDRLILEAHAKIRSLTDSEGAASVLDPTHDQQQNDRIWEQRCIAAEKKATILRAENARLRAALNEGTLTTPSEWQQAQQAQAEAAHQAGAKSRSTITPRPPNQSLNPAQQWKR